jgi:hypothetical protein
MAIVPVMWIVWSVFVLYTAALYVYRWGLTREEDDQIFLDDSFAHEKSAQEAILAKINRMEPYLRVGIWLVAAATVFVIGYYIMDIVNKLS